MNDPTLLPHPDFPDLLAARDVHNAGIESHLTQCPACTARFKEAIALRDELHTLPEIIPPADGWRRVSAQLSGQKKPSAPWRWPALAAAALLLIIAARSLHRRADGETAGSALASAKQPAAYGTDPAKTAAELPALISRSHTL